MSWVAFLQYSPVSGFHFSMLFYRERVTSGKETRVKTVVWWSVTQEQLSIFNLPPIKSKTRLLKPLSKSKVRRSSPCCYESGYQWRRKTFTFKLELHLLLASGGRSKPANSFLIVRLFNKKNLKILVADHIRKENVAY